MLPLSSHRRPAKEPRRWRELLLGALLVIIGAVLTTSLEIWKENWFFRTNVQAHLLNVAIFQRAFEAQVAVVNVGNRQGLLSYIKLFFTTHGGGLLGSGQFTISPSQVLLNPGDIRLVSVTGTLPMGKDMYINGLSVDPHVDNSKFIKDGERKTDVTLLIRGLDFQGRRYEARWRLATIYFRKNMVMEKSYDEGEEELNIFACRFFTNEFFPIELPAGAKADVKGQ